LGMDETIYCLPSGACHSTPEDQLLLWRAARQDPAFRDIVGRIAFTNADVAQEQAACGAAVDPFVKIGAEQATTMTAYPGMEGWKGGAAPITFGSGYSLGALTCDLAIETTQDACIFCLTGNATRLGFELAGTVLQSSSYSVRHRDLLRGMTYAFSRLFIPDKLAANSTSGVLATNVALASVDGILVVSASVNGSQFQLCSWTATPQAIVHERCDSRQFYLANGAGPIPPRPLALIKKPTAVLDTEYMSAALTGGKVTLQLWQLADPYTDN